MNKSKQMKMDNITPTFRKTKKEKKLKRKYMIYKKGGHRRTQKWNKK